MNLFQPTTFTWKQLGLLKWGVLLIGIAIGADWPDVFAPYVVALVIVGLILSYRPPWRGFGNTRPEAEPFDTI